MRTWLRRTLLVVAAPAGHVVRVGISWLPGLTGVALASTGVGLWLHQAGAGLAVAGGLLLADRVVTNLPQRSEVE